MDFLELIAANKIDDAYKLMKAKADVQNYKKEYDNDREVRDGQVGKRPDKVTKTDVIKVAKIVVPFQRKIVKSSASFLFGSPISISGSAEDEESIQLIRDQWRSMRMDSMLLKLCEAVKSETEAALVFFPVEKEGQDPKLKVRLLSNKNGKIYPVFDAFGDMVAFGWEYSVKDGDKEKFWLYLWTADKRYVYEKGGNSWVLNTENTIDNEFEKIPAVYVSQEHPEWWEVQDLIDRFENTFSKFADTNDYFAHPTYKFKGGANAKIRPDDSGRAVRMDIVETDRGSIIEADMDVLSWDRAPEALKLEFDTLQELIYGLTDTPNLSFDNVKGIGNVSGIALKLLFFGSILKSLWDQGDYEIAIIRMVKVIMAGMQNVLNTDGSNAFDELDFDVNFTSVLPENLKEIIEVLTDATGGKPVMTQRTAIDHNPLVMDKAKESDDLEAQDEKDKKLGLGLSVDL